MRAVCPASLTQTRSREESSPTPRSSSSSASLTHDVPPTRHAAMRLSNIVVENTSGAVGCAARCCTRPQPLSQLETLARGRHAAVSQSVTTPSAAPVTTVCGSVGTAAQQVNGMQRVPATQEELSPLLFAILTLRTDFVRRMRRRCSTAA
ncbi:hypothetical protein DQ04_09411030 [Trypanosoma grayi]|uniref:hypothetical protein n=1 Tax=Trypanosoma grayi TaxID=71804 RepID=UPI0004F465F1|nr:hypothetical protein DQ04_09411030 [Trypanosoma grayi]KEG07569.1 hypothetical protein DQ04_09411030 [Trypanosoma grayi]